MSALTSILVLGAGELGTEVIRALLELDTVRNKHADLTVVLRPAASSSTVDSTANEKLGCRIIRHDISSLDVAAVAQVFAPFDAVVSCLGFAAGPGTQLKITQAALKAQVKRFIPWQFGIDYDAIGRGSGQTLFDEQLDVRGLLRAQTAVDWVIVSTGIFISFVFEDFFGVVEGAKGTTKEAVTVRALGSWENGLSVTAVEDIGRLTAAILVDNSVKQEVVYVSGDTFTYDGLAQIVSSVLGRDVQRVLWSQEQLAQDLERDPDNTICKYRVAFAAGKGVSWNQAETYNARKGISVLNIPQYIEQRLL